MKIERGYILVARKILESDLMDKPPLYFKLWIWMLNKAAYKGSKKLQRGQFFTTIKEMQQAMSYKIGYRKVVPTIDKIRRAYEHFTNATMMTTTKTTRGIVITILNYNKYQNPKSYEAHTEDHTEDTTKPIVAPHGSKEGKEGIKKEIKTFAQFWKAYPKKKSKGQAEKAWKAINPDEQLLAIMLATIERAKKSEDWLKEGGQFIPYPATWLRAKGWADEIKQEGEDARIRFYNRHPEARDMV